MFFFYFFSIFIGQKYVKACFCGFIDTIGRGE